MAIEQFLGRTEQEIKATVITAYAVSNSASSTCVTQVQESLEGHLRAILATLTVEEVYRSGRGQDQSMQLGPSLGAQEHDQVCGHGARGCES